MISSLRQVQIRNFKSIDRAVVNLEPFTIFAGANGSGKSNFLESLNFGKDCLTHSLGSAASGIRPVPRWGSHTASRTGFRLEIGLGKERIADYAFEISWEKPEAPRISHEWCRVVSPSGEDVFEVVEGVFRQEIPGIRSQIQPDRLALAVASATQEFRPVYDFLLGMQFYSINPEAIQMGTSSVAGAPLDDYGANAASILLQLSKRTDGSALERINQLLSRLVPGIQGVQSHDRGGNRLGIEFQQEIGTAQPGIFEAWGMSDGTLRLLGLLLALYQPYPCSLVAIEEPEATLHPAAADLVLQVLLDAAQERQVLITTHSPDILDAKELSDDQIRVVTMPQGRTAIAPLAQASRQAIREHLFTPGELLRSNELNQDFQAATAAAEYLDLFGEIPLRGVLPTP